MYEIQPLLDYLYMKDKEGWEQARLGAYITAQVNSKKKLNLTDIIEFGWEKQKTETPVVTQEQKDEIIAEMHKIEQELNGK